MTGSVAGGGRRRNGRRRWRLFSYWLWRGGLDSGSGLAENRGVSLGAAALRAVPWVVRVIGAACVSLLVASAGAGADSWTFPGPVAIQAHALGVGVEIADGSLFVAGGDEMPNDPEAELLAADGSAFSDAGQMTAERLYGAGDVLTNGDVLIAGGDGWDSSTQQFTPAQATAEVWSPLNDTFTATGVMNVARQVFTVTTLPNGEALAVGGSAAQDSGSGSATAELYDPMTNGWTPTGSMAAGRLGQTATLLPDCRVLIVGDNAIAVTYDYVTGTFTAAGSEGAIQRSYQTATLLADGEVLIAGGVDLGNTPLNTASVWDPATGTFTPTANNMSDAHSQGFAVRLSDGRVAVGGGFDSMQPLTMSTALDIYSPATNSWTAGAAMPDGAASAEAGLLNNGDMAVVGAGLSGQDTEIYTPGPGGPAGLATRSELLGSDQRRGRWRHRRWRHWRWRDRRLGRQRRLRGQQRDRRHGRQQRDRRGRRQARLRHRSPTCT